MLIFSLRAKSLFIMSLLFVVLVSKVDGQVSYLQVNSETCGSVSGRAIIPDTAMCDLAAANLGLSGTAAHEMSESTLYPTGCFSDFSKTNSYYNTNAVTTGVCSSSRPCLCLIAPDCANTDGTALNDATCICGSVGCSTSTGLYCYESVNQCSLGPYYFSEVTSEMCSSVTGRVTIPDKAMCEVAAKSGGWSDKAAANWNEGKITPPGCYLQSETILRFNKNTASTVSCSSQKSCLCLTALECPNTNGNTLNDVACICGTAGCSASTGLRCTESVNTCHTGPPCTQTDGVLANNAACLCGVSSCSANTGLHCTLSANTCHTNPPCTQTDGVTANNAPCQCGSSSCSTSKGLYCYESINTCHTGPPCTQTDGVLANNAACQCSSASCSEETGLYCRKSANQCNLGSYYFSKVESEQCDSVNGRVFIPDLAMCGEAATSVSRGSELTAQIVSNDDRPTGCYLHSDLAIPRFNKNTASHASCSPAYSCLCLTAPDCSITDGTSPNDVTCICGSVGCSTGTDRSTGLYCNAAINLCSTSQISSCKSHLNQKIDDNTFSEISCACGDSSSSTICTESTGLFCNTATTPPSCSYINEHCIQDGKTKNLRSCHCGPINSGMDCIESESSNMYCAFGTCSTDPVAVSLTLNAYMLLEVARSGAFSDDDNYYCREEGITALHSITECNEAAVYLNLEDESAMRTTSATDLDWTTLPGCSVCTDTGSICDVGLNYNVNNEMYAGEDYVLGGGGQNQQGICVERFTNIEQICSKVDGTNATTNHCICGASTSSSIACTADGVTPRPNCFILSANKYTCRAPCPAGSFRSTKFLNPDCETCTTPGYYCPQGSTTSPTQFPCQPGEYSDGIGAAACKHCPVGKFNLKQAMTVCLACPAGQFQDVGKSTACKPCVPGTFQNKTKGAATCRECTEGKYQKESGKPYCLPCIPGKYQPNQAQVTCADCPTDTYSVDAEQIECQDCDPAQYSSGGKTFCVKCSAGSQIDGTLGSLTCVKCTGGQFNSAPGGQCENCSAGTYNDTDNFYCISCAAGKWSSVEKLSDPKNCHNCGIGYYSMALGANSLDTCIACQPGKVGTEAGASSETTCENCGLGEYRGSGDDAKTCLKCLPGSKNPGRSGSCLPCIPGEYQNEEGKSACKLCKANEKSQNASSTKCDVCASGRTSTVGSVVCSSCSAGRFVEVSTDACLTCPAGYVSKKQNSQTCQQCGTGIKGESSDAGETTCSPCDLGKYQTTPGVCKACPLGFFQDTKGAQQCLDPTFCPPGKVPNNQSTACERPEYTLPENCKSGEQYLNDTMVQKNEWVCQSCPDGADCNNNPRWHQVVPKKNYRQMSFDNQTFGKCLKPNACNSSTACMGGHSGELCSQCLLGYSASSRGTTCEQCEDSGNVGFVFAVTIVISLSVFSYLVYDNLDGARLMIPSSGSSGNDDDNETTQSTSMPFHTVAIRIVSSYFQISGMLLKFNMTLPKSVQVLVEVESGASTLGERLLMFECLTDLRGDFQLFTIRELFMVWLIPLISVCLCAVFWFVLFRRKWSTDGFVSSGTTFDKYS